MRSGNEKSARRHTSQRAVIAAAVGLALMAALSACEDHSPVAAPTSTLPAPSPTEEAPTPPEYETDLDLNDEEKEAVDEALVALDGFVDFSNTLFKSGGELSDNAESVATDESLREIKDAAETMREDGMTIEGKVTIEHRVVSSVDLSNPEPTVFVRACSPSSTYEFSKAGSTESTPPDNSNPIFEFKVANTEDSWKVAQQLLVREKCDM